MSDEKDRKMWHEGFYGGIQIELRKYRDSLEYLIEHTIGKEPLIADMIIIKKAKDVIIDNEIGRIFRRHNIIEYKSPDDGLTVDDFGKALSYASLYKSNAETVNGIPFDELTISLVRDTFPRSLINEFLRLGAAVDEKYSGIYYIGGLMFIPIQIVVTSELKSTDHSWLKVLSNRASEEDVINIMTDSDVLTEQGDLINANAVFNVSAAANNDLFTKVRSVRGMNENAFYDIFFKDKAEKIAAESEAKGRAEGEAKGRAEERANIFEALRQLGVSEELLDQAAKSV